MFEASWPSRPNSGFWGSAPVVEAEGVPCEISAGLAQENVESGCSALSPPKRPPPDVAV